MLQQTRVESVIPYFNRFVSNFPSVQDLAEADLDTVLNLWAGLGYYSRARNLHAAAKQVTDKFNGTFPKSFKLLCSLKGVGPYTAAAISSIAFDEPHCALDGNLERVFSRLLALYKNPKSDGRPELISLGEEMAKLGRPGDLNQAVMDLSSMICRPKNPQCKACPLSAECNAFTQGVQSELPVKKIKAEKISLEAEGWVVIAENELLVARRPAGAWLAGMWDLPWKIVEEGHVRLRAKLGEEFASTSAFRTITKHKIDFNVRGLLFQNRPSLKQIRHMCAIQDKEMRWVSLESLHGLNLPRPSEKALGKILRELN